MLWLDPWGDSTYSMSMGPKEITSAHCGSLVMVSSKLFDPQGLIHAVSGRPMCLLPELCVVFILVLFWDVVNLRFLGLLSLQLLHSCQRSATCATIWLLMFRPIIKARNYTSEPWWGAPVKLKPLQVTTLWSSERRSRIWDQSNWWLNEPKIENRLSYFTYFCLQFSSIYLPL